MQKAINIKRFVCMSLFFLVFSVGCNSNVSDDQIARALKNNPDIVIQIIKDNAEEISGHLQKAALAEYKRNQLEQAFSDRKEPVFLDTRPLKPGSVADPKVEIVVYSDFSCGYCKTGAQLLDRLQEKYKGQTKIIFKHSAANQVSYHKALIFEAAGQIDPKLAWDLHDFMFDHQDQLFENLDVVNAELTKRGIVLKEFYDNMNSETIIAHISSDNEEVRNFDIKGTPTFVVNGVKIEGVLPFDELVSVVEKTLQE